MPATATTVTTTTVQPVRPCARNVRAALKRANLAHLVDRVTTGRRACRVSLNARTEEEAEQVAQALRALWHDGDERVRVIYSGLVVVAFPGYWNTVPATPEGLAQLADREEKRTAGLLATRVAGRRLFAAGWQAVEYQPVDEQPRRPWVDRAGRRYTSFEVTAC